MEIIIPDNQSGDQNNPKNLFTQTAFSQSENPDYFEGKVRNALKQEIRLFFRQRQFLGEMN